MAGCSWRVWISSASIQVQKVNQNTKLTKIITFLCHEDVWRNGGTAAITRNLATTYMQAVSFLTQPRYSGEETRVATLGGRHICHLSQCSTRSIQSMLPSNFSQTLLILSSHLHLGPPKGLLPSGLPTKLLYVPPLAAIRATYPAHPCLLDLITRMTFGEWNSSMKSKPLVLSFHCISHKSLVKMSRQNAGMRYEMIDEKQEWPQHRIKNCL